MSASYRFGPFALDPKRLTLFADGQAVHLAPKVIQTLAILTEHPGDLVTKSELMDRLWPDGFVEDGNLTQNMYVLRRTLQTHGLEHAIENIPRRGYRFTAPVRTALEDSGKPALPALARVAATAIVLAAMALTSLHAPAARQAPLPPDGRRLYTLGRYYWSLRSPSGLARAQAEFSHIIKRYPRSALGYAGLADTYTEMYDYVCDGAPCASTIMQAQRYASRAIAADPYSSEAHTSAAMTARLFEHDATKSDAEFDRALSLDPKNALAYEWYGNSLLARGEVARARTQLQQAAALEPVSVATYAWLARDAYYAHRFSESVADAREALAINPRRIETTIILGLALEQNANERAALSTFASLPRIGASKSDAQALIAGAYAHAGRRVLALKTLRAAAADRYDGDWLAKDVALGFLSAGQSAQALQWLRVAHFATNMDRVFFALDPRLDPVRRDSRFRTWTTLISMRT